MGRIVEASCIEGELSDGGVIDDDLVGYGISAAEWVRDDQLDGIGARGGV